MIEDQLDDEFSSRAVKQVTQAATRHSAPAGEETQHTVTVDVHRSESLDPVEVQSPPATAPTPDSDRRQDRAFYSDCSDTRNHCSLKYCGVMFYDRVFPKVVFCGMFRKFEKYNVWNSWIFLHFHNLIFPN